MQIPLNVDDMANVVNDHIILNTHHTFLLLLLLFHSLPTHQRIICRMIFSWTTLTMFVIFISGRRLLPFIMRLRFLVKQIEEISWDYCAEPKKKLLIPMNHDGWLYFLLVFFFFSATKARWIYPEGKYSGKTMNDWWAYKSTERDIQDSRLPVFVNIKK